VSFKNNNNNGFGRFMLYWVFPVVAVVVPVVWYLASQGYLQIFYKAVNK